MAVVRSTAPLSDTAPSTGTAQPEVSQQITQTSGKLTNDIEEVNSAASETEPEPVTSVKQTTDVDQTTPTTPSDSHVVKRTDTRATHRPSEHDSLEAVDQPIRARPQWGHGHRPVDQAATVADTVATAESASAASPSAGSSAAGSASDGSSSDADGSE